MTTEAQRNEMRRELRAASERAERAAYYGDRAGALIAGSQANVLRLRLENAQLADILMAGRGR